MPLVRERLLTKEQTGRRMYALVERFYHDIGPLSKLSLPAFFDKVRKVPYKRDPTGEEWLVRPGLLLKEFSYMDCKKKAILCASWLRANRFPYRFVAVSEIPSRRIHHVFTQGFIDGEWRNVDATLPSYRLFSKKLRVTKAEILPRG